MRKRLRNRRTGFVLAVALAFIALAAIALAGFARTSLSLAREAVQAREDLQRRWGTISCQRVLLKKAERILDAEADYRAQLQQVAWPLPAIIASEISLGGMRFSLQIADENAKINLNSLARRTPEAVRQVVTESLVRAGAQDVSMKVEAYLSKGQRDRTLFQSWGQVLDLSALDLQAAGSRSLPLATQELSCWGSGQLNIRRASTTAIRAICEREISATMLGKLLTARQEANVLGLADLINKLAPNARERATLRTLFTDKAQCHSLWISAVCHERVWRTFVIDQPGQSRFVNTECLVFSW